MVKRIQGPAPMPKRRLSMRCRQTGVQRAGGCEQTCVESGDDVTCSCNDGFALADDGTSYDTT